MNQLRPIFSPHIPRAQYFRKLEAETPMNFAASLKGTQGSNSSSLGRAVSLIFRASLSFLINSLIPAETPPYISIRYCFSSGVVRKVSLNGYFLPYGLGIMFFVFIDETIILCYFCNCDELEVVLATKLFLTYHSVHKTPAVTSKASHLFEVAKRQVFLFSQRRKP